MKKIIQIQLSVMMFLEFFIWGAWYVTMGTYLPNTLGTTDPETAMAYSTQSWGAILAPFIIGLIADRYFNAERILGVLHLLGALLMYLLYSATDYTTFYPYLLFYMIMYMSTLALVNSVSFNQMKDPAKEFSFIRVFGTLGWIAAGLLISYLSWDSAKGISEGMLKYTFLMASICSVILGVFSFTLPRTPPIKNSDKKTSLSEILGLDALALLKDRNFLLFFISSVLVCIPLAFYFQNLSVFLTESNVDNSTAWSSIGQFSEIMFLLLLPFFLKKFGFKKTIIVGMLAWIARYILFSFGNSGDLFSLLVLGIFLHGICYDFFFVCGQIYTDSKAGKKYKSAAQGLITLATYGIGMLIGFWVSGMITDSYLNENAGHDWASIWLFPAGFAFVVFIFFTLFFKNEKITYKA
ncbi:MFS transporter [Maribacter sp. HTCC2170]|uniref:MFS transporter n=1 Tax=Maribacter sp. (strain HTCC2170 / KCCM 42371) TaxID=313603 RepID=UPI00006BD230|nr:MFS transporter [Maribacter sp. HTCC2170]EAR02610.1 putative nucleoside permease [Maribacter sp. HTCC2170]